MSIRVPNDYSKSADILADLKEMAESIEEEFAKKVEIPSVEGLATNGSVDEKLNNKVDKETGKVLSSNDYTDEDKAKLEGLENYDDKEIRGSINLISESSESLSSRVAVLEKKAGKVYGVRRKLTDNSSSEWERLEDSAGLIANATKDGSYVQNDFDRLYPWREIKSCNINENGEVVAYIGEPGFAFDGSNGEVMTRIPEFWYKREVLTDAVGNEWEYIYIADYEKEGFVKSNEFFVGRYIMSVDEKNVGHSKGGGSAFKASVNIATFRSYARNRGNGYCLMDWRIFIIQMLYLVEYANYNSQQVLGKGVSLSVEVKPILEENNTNRAILNSNVQGFYVGRMITVNNTVRKIIEMNDYEEENVSGKEIVFDGTATDIKTTAYIRGSFQRTGDCDCLGMYSGCLVDDGYHSVIYRGIENIFGNAFCYIDGINIKDYQIYVCYEPESYAQNYFESPYELVGYMVSSVGNSYVKRLGFDEGNQAIMVPTEVGGSSNSYVTDKYNCSNGSRVSVFGGWYPDGLANGLFRESYDCAPNNTSYNIGARLLKYK